MTTTTLTITRRSRNLGIGSTSQPRRNPTTGRLEIESVDAPDVVGGLAAVMAEYDRACRVNSGHDYRVSFFVGGAKVLRDDFLTAASLLRAKISDAETVTAV